MPRTPGSAIRTTTACGTQLTPLRRTFRAAPSSDPDHSWEGGRAAVRQRQARRLPQVAQRRLRDRLLPPGGQSLHARRSPSFTLYDRYFASLLGPTWPNRKYMHSAQSGGNKSKTPPQAAVQAYFPAGASTSGRRSGTDSAQGITCTYYFSDLPFIGCSAALHEHPAGLRVLRRRRRRQLPHVAFVDPPFLDGGGGRGAVRRRAPSRRHPARAGLQVGRRPGVPPVAPVQERRDVRQLRRVGRVLRPCAPGPRARRPASPTSRDDLGITGFRVPGVAISPYAPRRTVNHMKVTHESILKMITYRFGLGDLNKRHRYATNIGELVQVAEARLQRAQPPLADRSRDGRPARRRAGRARPPLPARMRASTRRPDLLDYFTKLGYDVGPPAANGCSAASAQQSVSRASVEAMNG